MSLYLHDSPVSWPSHDLDPKIQRQAREWVAERARRALPGYFVIALISIPMVIAPFFVLAWAFLVLRSAKSLARNGIFVPTLIVNGAGLPADYKNATEAWNGSSEERFTGLVTSADKARAVQRSVHHLLTWCGGYIPALVVHHRFRFESGHRTMAKAMFGDEHFYVDQEGWSWALVHPKHPRLMQWPISTSGPAPRAAQRDLRDAA